jgi:hypothetical protein
MRWWCGIWNFNIVAMKWAMRAFSNSLIILYHSSYCFHGGILKLGGFL